MSHYPNDYMVTKIWKETFSLRETGRRLGISKDTVKRILNRQGFDTSQPRFDTVIRENDMSQPRFDTSQNPSQGKGKGRGSVGGKMVFLTLALIFIGCLFYIIYAYLEKRERDRKEVESQENEKTFGFEGKSVEEL